MMSHHEIPRVALLIGLLLLIPVLLYHRIRSQATGEKLDRRQEGLFILVALRALGLAFQACLIAYLVNPATMAWSSVELPFPIRAFALVTLAAGGMLLIWTLRHLGKNLTDTVVTRKTHTLVTTGPYRWVRHPFYDAVALLIGSVSVIASNWFLLLLGTLTLILIGIRTRKEEEMLLQRFGDDYRAYRGRTGRFLPRPL